MNAKLKKSLNIAAAAIFVVGLAINVQMILDDPFGSVNAVVLAQQTGTGDTGDDCGNWFWDCDSLYSEVTAACVCTVMVAPGGVGGSYTIPGSIDVCQSGGPDFCFPDAVCICGYI